MASTTRATAVIDFKANTTELEKLQKKLEKSSTIPMDDNLRNQFQTLSVETKQFIDSLKKIPAEDMTPDLVKELVKQKDKLFDSTAKLNKALLSTVDKSTGELVNRLQSEIKVLDKDIARRTKELEDMNKKFPDDPNKEGARQFGSPLKESQFIRETAEGEGLRDQMKGPSGQSIKDFGVMIQLADEMKKTFTESGAAYEKLNTHIESGKTFKEAMSKLTKAEREELEKVNGENFKNFSLQESINQIQIRKTLEQKKQDFLHKTAVDYANKQNNLELDIASRKQKQLQIDTQLANAAKNNTAEKQQQLQFSQELNDITLRGYAENAKTLEGVKEATKSATVAVKEKTKEVERNRSTLGKATQQVFSYGIAFTALRRIYRETLRTIRDLDKALTEMAIVTSMNRKETWQLVGTMQQLSRETGFTTTEIAKLSTIYFRQGRTLREVTELTRVAAIGARIAGISAAESADFLTSAVNAFQLSADQALQVSDKFAALAAQSASSYEELAVGLSKFAAQANVAGVSIDFAMGLLAKGVETTREAPETIGTALKTVIARMRELTDLGKTFEDGMDISRVETALRQVGVALRDDQGQFRNLELVLTELGQRWATLNTNQQASIAVSLAGTRQQSRLIAIMQDFDRTLELVDISQNSAGATMAQHTQFMRGMEAASVGLQNAYQQFITTITDSELIIGIIRGLSSAISGLANGLQAIGFSGQLAMISLMGIFTVLKLKAPVMKLINNSIIAQALAQERKRIIDLADIKIEKAKLLLNKKQISDSTKIRAQQILDNALETKKQALTTKGLILQKLQILGNKAELQSRITKIQSLIGEKIAKVGLIFVNGALLASTKKLIAGMLVFFKVLLTNPIGWIIIAVGLLIKGFMDLRKGNSTLAASFASSFKSIGNLVKSVFNAFMSLFKAIAPLVILVAKFKAVMMFGGIIAGLVVAFKALQVVLNVLAGVFNYVAGGIQFAVNWFEELISKIPLLQKAIELIERVGRWAGKIIDSTREFAEESERWAAIQSKTYKELAQDLADFRKESQAENYELLRKNQNLKSILREYEEIQELRAKGLLGEQELEREAALLRELENLEGDLVRRASDGITIDFVATIANLQANIEENAEVVAENMRAIADRALDLFEKDKNRFMAGEGGALNDVVNFLLSGVEGDFSEKQQQALASFFTNIVKSSSDLDLDALAANTSYEKLIDTVAEFSDILDKNEDGILGAKTAFDELSKAFTPEETQQLEAFRESFQDLTAVFDMLERQTPVIRERMGSVLNVIGTSPETLNRLNSALGKSGVSLEEFLASTGGIVENLRALDPTLSITEATSQAISSLAATMEDAETRAALYSLAMGKSLLEVSQAADHLASRFENLRETQQKFLEGDLPAQDLMNFIDGYLELFGDESFVDAFVNGMDLSIFLFKEAQGLAEDYRNQLFAVTQQIAAADAGLVELTEDQRKALNAEQARIRLLMDYQGELRGVTTAQYDFNKALQAYELFTRMGIDAIDIQTHMVTKLQQNVGSALRLVDDQVQNAERNIQTILGTIDPSTIYEIVDGVVQVTDAYRQLAPEIRQALDIQLQFIEQGLGGIYDIFEALMNETLALEENMAKERIKVYEDYFAAIDRLEDRRKRKIQREDLVEQLARLEGATDERSRRKALDLRKDLNALDEKTAQETTKEAREALVASINESVETIRETFQEVFREFIRGGSQSAEALYDSLVAAGLIDGQEGGWAAVEASFMVTMPDAKDIPTIKFDEESIANINEQLNELFGRLNDPDLSDDEKGEIEEEIKLLQDQLTALQDIRNLLGFEPETETTTTTTTAAPADAVAGPSASTDVEAPVGFWRALGQAFVTFAGRNVTTSAVVPVAGSRRDGGMASETAPYMLHGTNNRPEAVLSATQTEMFVGLRNALEGSVANARSGSDMGAINIESISISTGSLNNSQDFNKAGKVLAEAFRASIQRKGVTINTNKV